MRFYDSCVSLAVDANISNTINIQKTMFISFRRKTAKGLAIYVLLFFALWTIRATILFPIDQSISSPALGQIYADTLRIILWVVPVFLYVARIDKTNAVEFLRLNTVGSTKAIFQASIVTLLYFVIILFIDSVRAGTT